MKNKKRFILYGITSAVLLIAIVLSLILPFRVTLDAKQGFLSLSLSGAQAADDILSVSIKNSYPTFTVSKWNSESTIDFGIKWDGLTTLTTVFTSIKAESASYKVEFTQTPSHSKFNEDGGFDIIFTLKEKPDTNRILFSYNPKLVDAYFQPPISTEWKIGEDAGLTKKGDKRTVTTTSDNEIRDQFGDLIASRPDYAVNSIAFYGTGKIGDYSQLGGFNYSTGKIGQLYRMTDSEGRWSDWSIESGQIALTIDQKTIDEGKYPIIVSPVGDTFGYTSFGASAAADGGDQYYSVLVTCPSAGTAVSITYGLKGDEDDSGVGCQVAIYDNAGSTKVVGGASAGQTLTRNTAGWHTNNVIPALSATTYNLAAWGQWSDYAGYAGVCYDAGDANTSSTVTRAYGAWPASITVKNAALKYSIYCTYTPSGGAPAITNTPATRAFGTLYNSQTYYSNNLTLGYVPTFALTDAQCYFTITNSGTASGNITASATNFTGGVTISLTDAAPGATTARLSLYRSGDANSSDNTTLSTSARAFITSLAASATKKWEIRLETPTSDQNDANQKTCTITFTISSP